MTVPAPGRESQTVAQPEALRAAYTLCRAIARREAKNFYWSFRALPRHKSDAMCAVYAFMRRADDLADDESLSLEARREAMAEWFHSWRASAQTTPADPVFLALRDTQQRFRIPDQLLEELVQGTTMDLADQEPGTTVIPLATLGEDGYSRRDLQVYESFADLRRYCYLVASVVGLTCIRVFGYTDPAAEALAEETGLAFQLTNILRDVEEDAARNRIYLPLDELEAAGATPEQVVTGQLTPQLHGLLATLGGRAESLYASADRLLPLIDADSRAALWVMATIYHGLLREIVRKDFRVFGRRIRLSAPRKLLILLRGLLMARRLRRSRA